MWTALAVASAFLLGLYDVAKKQALRKNGVLAVLLVATALSALFTSPFLRFGPAPDHLKLGLKAVLVTLSWISGMIGLKLLPLTTVSMLKGSRPMFVVLFSIILFGETLSWTQWAGVLVVLAALFLLGWTSRGDAPVYVRKEGFIWMGLSIVTGVASALFDKHIMKGMEPLFVQSWTNLYITVILSVLALINHRAAIGRRETAPEGLRFAHPSHSLRGGPLPLTCPGVDTVPQGQSPSGSPQQQRFQWDWWLVAVAVLITAADALYFFALKQPDALLSVISLIRRASVIITFICGIIFFKEKNVGAKSLNLLLLAAGVVLLLIG